MAHLLESKSASYEQEAVREEFLSLLAGERKELFTVVLYSFAIAILSLFVPIGVQTIVNTVAFGALLQPVLVIAVLVFIGITASGVLDLSRYWIVELIQQRLFVRVSVSLAHRLARMCHTVFREEFAPELVNRFFEVVTVQKALSKLALDGIAIAIQASVGLVLLSFYHPYFLVYSLLLLGWYFAVILLPLRSAIYTSSKECSAKHSVLIWLENIAGSPLLFKNVSGRDFGTKIADDLTTEYLYARRKHFRIVFTQNIGLFLLKALGSGGLLGLGGYLFIIEELSLGQLVAAELIVSGILSGMSKTGVLMESFYDLTASLAKLDSLAQLPLEEYAGDCPRLGDGEGPLAVSINNLSHGFSSEKTILKGVSLDVASGSKVAIYGGNGSGKSLLAELLLKLHVPTQGQILFENHDLRDLSPEAIRDQAIVLRKLEIFRGTVEENVRLGRDKCSNQELREALTAVGLETVIEELPNGLGTMLAESGRPLSSGQAMRLMLARAILLKPRLLIIDESLDSLDRGDVTDFVIPALTSAEAPWTLIVMTHDQRLAEDFESAYMLVDGVLSQGLAAE